MTVKAKVTTTAELITPISAGYGAGATESGAWEPRVTRTPGVGRGSPCDEDLGAELLLVPLGSHSDEVRGCIDSIVMSTWPRSPGTSLILRKYSLTNWLSPLNYTADEKSDYSILQIEKVGQSTSFLQPLGRR